MSNLRKQVIKLAKANPGLRGLLVPLLQEKTAADPTYKNYVERKKQEGEKPLPKEDWESRVLGKKPEKKPSDSAPQSKKTKIHAVYDKHPILQEAFDHAPTTMFDKNKGYSAKPIRDMVKTLKTMVKIDEVPALLKASEAAYQDTVDALSQASMGKGYFKNPEYKAMKEGPYAKAINTWRAMRVLSDESKEHPKSFKKKSSMITKQAGRYSPWGEVDYSTPLTRGLVWVTTPGHGGLGVSAGLAKSSLSAIARKFADAVSGGYYWYEEDVAWAIPFYEHPEWIPFLKKVSKENRLPTVASIEKIIKSYFPRLITHKDEEFVSVKKDDCFQVAVNYYVGILPDDVFYATQDSTERDVVVGSYWRTRYSRFPLQAIESETLKPVSKAIYDQMKAKDMAEPRPGFKYLARDKSKTLVTLVNLKKPAASKDVKAPWKQGTLIEIVDCPIPTPGGNPDQAVWFKIGSIFYGFRKERWSNSYASFGWKHI